MTTIKMLARRIAAFANQGSMVGMLNNVLISSNLPPKLQGDNRRQLHVAAPARESTLAKQRTARLDLNPRSWACQAP
jgi:hypothetical protein